MSDTQTVPTTDPTSEPAKTPRAKPNRAKPTVTQVAAPVEPEAPAVEAPAAEEPTIKIEETDVSPAPGQSIQFAVTAVEDAPEAVQAPVAEILPPVSQKTLDEMEAGRRSLAKIIRAE
jgi:hypothetical protein